MKKDVKLIEEMTKEELTQIEKEIEAGTCKVGIPAEQMYYQLVGKGVLKNKRTLLEEKDFLKEINANTEKIMAFAKAEDKKIELERLEAVKSFAESEGIKLPETRNIYNTPALTRYNVNLHKHMTSWAVYRPGVVPVNGNQVGYVRPSNYGGLGYRAYNLSYTYADVFHIPTESYGEVQIWVPADNDACRNMHTAVFGWSGSQVVEGRYASTDGDWKVFGCQKGWAATSPTHKGSSGL